GHICSRAVSNDTATLSARNGKSGFSRRSRRGARLPLTSMKTRKDRDLLLLAIYPTTRGFGFVVFEGRDRTIDWGVKDAHGDKNRKVLAKIEELVSWYKPDMLVLENAHGAMSRRAKRIRQLHGLIIELAKNRDIRVQQFSRSDIKATFKSRSALSRYEIAQAV